MFHMKIYLAGPMSGYPNFNFAAFDYAARKLRDLGFEVFSPAENDRKHHPGVEDNPTGDVAMAEKATGFTRRKALEEDTTWICREANAIALLPGWGNSTGARTEANLGEALGLTLIKLGTEFDLHAQQK